MGVGLRAGLLQVRDGMWFLRKEAPYNTVLRPILFTSKNLTGTENHYSNIQRETLGIL